ncbi:hypothetical protein [Thermomonospora umbrina]|uniref:Uncharacterized protein n=1 Tax=Thermomonospora umbrina TaxID=111806 RepID=A0A3D9T986_9ACTN|nr:hypothetical protein [Thermomonospora umbrina]REF00322.1 hypothetical protein DFJ69_5853 [Thermomonospora umbrina]
MTPDHALALEALAVDAANLSSAKVAAPLTKATIYYKPDTEEAARREATGLTAVTRLDWLDRLMNLPIGLPVPGDDLTKYDRRDFLRLPPGRVDLTLDGVVRRITRPLDVKLAVVTGRQWRPGLTRASRYASYCPRALVLTGSPKDLHDAAVTADLYGIGLVINACCEPELVVAPAPFEQYRHTPAGWAFLEEVHRQAVKGENCGTVTAQKGTTGRGGE